MTPQPLPDALAVFDVTANGYATKLQLSYVDAAARGVYTGPPPIALPWGESFPRAGVHQAGRWDDVLKSLEAATLAGLSGDVDDCLSAIGGAIVALKATPAGPGPDYDDLDDAIVALKAAPPPPGAPVYTDLDSAIVALKATPPESEPDYSDLDDAVVALKATPAGSGPDFTDLDAAVTALEAAPAPPGVADYTDVDNGVLALRGAAVALHAAAQPVPLA